MQASIKQFTAILLTVVLLLCSFTSCKSNKDSTNDENDNSNNITLSNHENKEDVVQDRKTLAEISSTGQIPYDKFCFVSEHGLKTTDTDLFTFKYSSKYGFADSNGNVIIAEQYDDVYLFSEGKAFAKLNNEWIIIDTKGNELCKIPTEYSKSLSTHENSGFKNGKAICTYTSIDSSNYYINILIINSDLSTSQTQIPTNAGLKYKIVNTPEFAGIITYNAYVEYDDSGIRNDKVAYRLFDLSGNKIWETETLYETLSPKVEQFEYKKALAPNYSLGVLESLNIENGYMNIFDENFKWGLMNVKTGEIVLNCNYDYVGAYSNGLCNVCSYGKWGFVDLNGSQAMAFNYKYTEKFVNEKALVIMEDNSFCVINKTGEIVFDCGIIFNHPSGTQCKYQIHTDLQEKGIIVIWNYYGDEYYLINIGDSTKTIDDGLYTSIASPNNIFINKRMFELI